MKNNYWEEQNMSSDIFSFHEESISEMGLPDWVKLNCPHCDAELSLRSLRTIGMKLNTRNKGDLIVEVCCSECRIMDTIYFRRQIREIKDFIALLDGLESPDCPPVVEEEMYKLRYNNVMEEMAVKKRGTK